MDAETLQIGDEMKKVTARVSTHGQTWPEIEAKVDSLIQTFLGLDDEEFKKIYDKLEITIYSELASAESSSFFCDANFRIPTAE
jgi:hypothetical protein